MDTALIIAEDHELLRSSIRAICTSIDINNVEEVNSCQGLLKQLKQKKFTHLILDLMLADDDSLEVLERVRREYPSLRIMVYASHPSYLYRVPMKRIFGCEYISKGEPRSVTIKLLIEFLQGQPSSERSSATEDIGGVVITAPMEMIIAHYLLLGWGPVEIAKKVGVKAQTVRNLKTRILDKTGVRHVSDLKFMDRSRVKRK